jgi:flagellar biosynthesis component FlhA
MWHQHENILLRTQGDGLSAAGEIIAPLELSLGGSFAVGFGYYYHHLLLPKVLVSGEVGARFTLDAMLEANGH